MLVQGFLAVIFIGFLLNKFYFRGRKCTSKAQLDNKTVIVTGANTGIGFETCLDLASRGAHVIMACRDTKKAEKAALDIQARTLNKDVEVEYLDLADLDTVRSFAKLVKEKHAKIDILINNAGLMQSPYWKTKQGLEMQLGVNHLGHFLLTNLLLDLLKASPSSRIINVSSIAHIGGQIKWDDINSEKSYSSMGAYCQSKLANILFTIELAERLKGTSVTSVALHPGAVRTEILRHSDLKATLPLAYLSAIFYPLSVIFLRSPKQGSQTTLHCALDESIPKYNGCYFDNCRPVKAAKQAQSGEDARRLWEVSSQLVGLN